ncbi:MAG: TfoX/Sxy family protein [Gemmatimonadota bacterium]
MKNPSLPVDQLRNVGPTIARRLREIGIQTSGELRSIGAVNAYARIRARNPGKTIPVCYYLYSLEGALRDQHWDALSSKVKQHLLSRVSPNRALKRTPAGGRR